MDYEKELRAVLAQKLADESRSDMSSNRDFSVRQIVECLIDDLLEQDNDEVAEEMIRFAREHPEATESELFEHYEDQWDPPEIVDDDEPDEE